MTQRSLEAIVAIYCYEKKKNHRYFSKRWKDGVVVRSRDYEVEPICSQVIIQSLTDTWPQLLPS